MQALDMAAREGQRDDAVRGAEVDANSCEGTKISGGHRFFFAGDKSWLETKKPGRNFRTGF